MLIITDILKFTWFSEDSYTYSFSRSNLVLNLYSKPFPSFPFPSFYSPPFPLSHFIIIYIAPLPPLSTIERKSDSSWRELFLNWKQKIFWIYFLKFFTIGRLSEGSRMNSIAFSYHLLLPMGGRLAGNIPSLRGEPFSKGGNSDSTLSVQGV